MSNIKDFLPAKRRGSTAGATDLGLVGLGVRKDTATDLAGGDGKYAPHQYDANGNLRVIDEAVKGFVDGLETLVTNLIAAVNTVDGHVDGIEALIGTTNTLVTALNGFVDGLEGYTDQVEGKLDTLHTDERPIQGMLVITPDSNQTTGRQIAINCTAAGNVQLKLADDTLLTIPVDIGLLILPFAVKTVVSAQTTATATYANLV